MKASELKVGDVIKMEYQDRECYALVEQKIPLYHPTLGQCDGTFVDVFVRKDTDATGKIENDYLNTRMKLNDENDYQLVYRLNPEEYVKFPDFN